MVNAAKVAPLLFETLEQQRPNYNRSGSNPVAAGLTQNGELEEDVVLDTPAIIAAQLNELQLAL